MWKCKHCLKDFEFVRTTEKANHSKWCPSNPKLASFKANLKKAQIEVVLNKFGRVKLFPVICSHCQKPMMVSEHEKQFPKKKRYFCSRKCSNSVGGAAKAILYHSDAVANYTTVCFRHHKKKCVVCDFSVIVAVHHIDENHGNNDPKNLVPLCPNHHAMMHSKHRPLVQSKVDEYVEKKWGMGLQGVNTELAPRKQQGSIP